MSKTQQTQEAFLQRIALVEQSLQDTADAEETTQLLPRLAVLKSAVARMQSEYETRLVEVRERNERAMDYLQRLQGRMDRAQRRNSPELCAIPPTPDCTGMSSERRSGMPLCAIPLTGMCAPEFRPSMGVVEELVSCVLLASPAVGSPFCPMPTPSPTWEGHDQQGFMLRKSISEAMVC